MSNRVKILKSAISLFNQYGTDKITTNKIAKDSGISPGNLYYHFKNKEEIIREIFNEMIRIMDGQWVSEMQKPKESLKMIFQRLNTMNREYRFFQFEIIKLLNSDSLLANLYQDNRIKRKEEITLLLNSLIKNNFLIEIADEEKSDLIDVFWFIGEFRAVQVHLNKKEYNKEEIIKTFRAIYNNCFRYLTAEGKVVFDNMINEM